MSKANRPSGRARAAGETSTLAAVVSGKHISMLRRGKSTEWKSFLAVLKRLAPSFDVEAFGVVLAAVCAHDGNSLPVWLNINGPPSNGKTHILDALPTKPIPNPNEVMSDGLIALDSLTPRTLISGFANGKKPGLLERVQNVVLVVKDLSQQTSSEGQQEVFAQLRRVYDGEQALTFGSGKTFSWKGRITFICASVSHPGSFDTELGARFLCVTSRRAEYADALEAGRDELRRAVKALLERTPKPRIGEQDTLRVKPLAEALAIARAFVPRDKYKRDIIDEPRLESPHRLTRQLAALIASLRVLRGDSLADAYKAVLRVVVDTIPATRRAVLACIASNGVVTTADLVSDYAKRTGFIPSNTMIYRAIEELEALMIIKSEDEDAGEEGDDSVPKPRGRPSKLLSPGPRWRELDAPDLLDALRDWRNYFPRIG